MVIAAQVLHLTDIVQIRIARSHAKLPALEHPLTSMTSELVSWIRGESLEETLLHFTLEPKDKGIPLNLERMAYGYKDVNDKRLREVLPWEEVCFIQFIGIPQDMVRHALRKTKSTMGGMGGNGYWKPKPPPPRRSRRDLDDSPPRPPRPLPRPPRPPPK